MRTKKFSKTLLLFGALYINLVVCIAGSIFGTYCWYQYSSRASVVYEGTAVGGDEGSMEIGLASDFAIPELSSKGLNVDTDSISGKFIYWSSNQIDNETICLYEKALGYSETYIGPCSSGSYKTGDDFKLKASPVFLEKEELKPAKKKAYSFIELAFRPNGGRTVFLNKSTLRCENEIEEAARIHFSDPNDVDGNFIYNLTSIQNGTNDVAGYLNLNLDMYYDYNTYLLEHIYGEYSTTGKYVNNESDDYQITAEEITTFTANHRKGTRSPGFIPKTCEYLGYKNVLNQKPLTTIPSNGTVALLDCTIYMEGWDHSCIDLFEEVQYDLNLEFSFGA